MRRRREYGEERIWGGGEDMGRRRGYGEEERKWGGEDMGRGHKGCGKVILKAPSQCGAHFIQHGGVHNSNGEGKRTHKQKTFPIIRKIERLGPKLLPFCYHICQKSYKRTGLLLRVVHRQ